MSSTTGWPRMAEGEVTDAAARLGTAWDAFCDSLREVGHSVVDGALVEIDNPQELAEARRTAFAARITGGRSTWGRFGHATSKPDRTGALRSSPAPTSIPATGFH